MRRVVVHGSRPLVPHRRRHTRARDDPDGARHCTRSRLECRAVLPPPQRLIDSPTQRRHVNATSRSSPRRRCSYCRSTTRRRPSPNRMFQIPPAEIFRDWWDVASYRSEPGTRAALVRVCSPILSTAKHPSSYRKVSEQVLVIRPTRLTACFGSIPDSLVDISRQATFYSIAVMRIIGNLSFCCANSEQNNGS